MKLLIKNGEIIDGTGKPRYKADLLVENGIIASIGNYPNMKADLVIDAKDLLVVPGFVDILNHSDAYLTLFSNPKAESLVQQGITTALIGNCGSSLAPILNEEAILSLQKWTDIRETNINWLSVGEFLDDLEGRKRPFNIATLVGHATIRRALTKGEFGDLSHAGLERMRLAVKQGLEEGAWGLSLGLSYSHAKIALIEELIVLAKDVARENALLAIHLRDEGRGFLASINEALEILRVSSVSCHISHLKIVGEKFWDKFDTALEMLKRAKDGGGRISADMYPYRTIGSVLYVFLPEWAARGGKNMLLARLREPTIRKKIIEEMKEAPIDWGSAIIADGALDKAVIGKTVTEIARAHGMEPEETVLYLLTASGGRIIAFIDCVNEENMEKAVRSPLTFIASDGAGYNATHAATGKLVHPRSFGAFPEAIRNFVIEKKVMPWEEMIAKMTLRPAEKIGLKKRGKIEKGYFADIVILNPETIRGRATFQNPYQYAEGVEYVMVNGEVVLEKTGMTGKMPGRVLRRG